ncbi:MAG: DNA polymerase III subunit gamma/tau [Candidatus Zixiibacteriota bacterium]|nr:MAG: DNA polymerase III subunit gamma/tau [candidate division Zixibacteria bacterium]
MSYLVLARKYRPQIFADIVAQEHVSKTLQNSLKSDRIGSGYLFCGPRGTGKTTTARLLAKAVNCVKGPTPDPCNECPACLEITKGASLDVLEIDAASNTGVDDIRKLRENVRHSPTGGKKLIYIIDEVHRLSGPAFDALLKTLEEPPAHAMFILATTEPFKVPETILSRTQRFDFKRVSVKDLTEHLIKVASNEKMKVTDAALRIIARKADGSVRDSLSLLDQIAAYTTESISEKEVIEALGLVDRSFLFEFTKAIASKDSKSSLRLIKNLFDSGVDPKDFITELLEHFRILLVLSTDKESGELLSYGEEEVKEYEEQSEYFSMGDLIRLMKCSADLNADLKDSGLDGRLLLEMTAVKMAEMESTVKFQEVLDAIKQAPAPASEDGDLFGHTEKKKNDSITEPVTIVRHEPQQSQLPASPQPTYTRAVNLPIIESGWDNFLSMLRTKRPMLASQLGMAEIREVKDNKILLVYPASGENSRSIVAKTENLNLITGELRQHYKANVSLRFEIDHTKAAPRLVDEQKNENNVDVTELLKNSPRLKQIIDRFDGEIIGAKKLKK